MAQKIVSNNKTAGRKPSTARHQGPPVARPLRQRTVAGKTLFAQIGGQPALEAAVELFYQKVLRDPMLGGFFRGVDMKMLKSQQVAFFTQALGGPARYRGADMKSAHARMAIEPKHFAAVAGHLSATLSELGVPSGVASQVLAAVAALEGQIVNAAGSKSGSDLLPMMARSLDTLGTNVFIADRDLTIVYMNQKAREAMKSVEDVLEEKFGVSVDDLVGGSIDRFHGSRTKQIRRMLADASTLPIRSEIRVGRLILDLNVNPILDEVGNYVGVVVNWEEISEKKRLAADAARVSSMMENAPTNVVMANTEGIVQYMNPASLATLKKLEHLLPCKAEEIVGKSFDMFHKRPEHQKRIVADPKNLPFKSTIQLGPETLDLAVNAIYDHDKQYIGAMLTWEVVTEKLKLAKAASQAQSMIENAPINIMFADRDLVIRYINPASAKTLDKIAHMLPCKVSEVVGNSVDIFHKRPEHQRRLLSDPRNLPHHAHIKLNEETLDLHVSAIYDNEKNYMGAMVTWEIITERLATEAREKEMIERDKRAQQELRAKVDSMLEVVRAAASGDLTREVSVSGADAVGQMGEGLKSFLDTLRKSMQGISQNAHQLGAAAEELSSISHQMAGNSEETASQANVVSAASEEVSKNVGVVATGSEEMLASIREISKSSTESARVAQTAVSVAEATNQTISKLGDSSQEIGKVIKVITSIAQQTNLLALNATIEAARAGEAGKGFAVVANEVKELAKETAKATEEISQKIEAIQGDTKNAIKAIGEISEIIAQVNEISNTIASAVEEQTATTNEIGRNLTEASKGVEEIAKNISGVADAAQSTARGASETQEASSALTRMASELQGLVGRFTV
ncbi:MAG: methyl-accepting chemotaxis protein [Bryobacteraceae bacterium]